MNDFDMHPWRQIVFFIALGLLCAGFLLAIGLLI